MSITDTNGEPLKQSRVRDKWDGATDPGFLTLPYVLLLHQAELGISSEHLNVLLNVIAHWHSNGRMPYPRSTSIARRMGISERTVQRSLSWLIHNGFLAKVPRLKRDDPQAYDMAPLVRKLKPYADERIKYIQMKDYERVLDDNIHLATQKTVKEMFGSLTAKPIADEL
jgi:DNA-binding MarR family transcriptional regulator